MKPYASQNRLPVGGVVLLVIGSILLGILIGALAYWISELFYFIVLFPIFVSLAAVVVYVKLVGFAKVNHPVFTAIAGFATGLFIAGGFYGTPYLIARHDVVTDIQSRYDVSAQSASEALDAWLVDETGSGGFWGFMKLRAIEGDQYSNYLILNAAPVSEIRFTLKSTWAWIYWFIETLLFSLPIAWAGFETGKGAFSRSANEWYSSHGNQLGVIPVEHKEELLTLFQRGHLSGICDLLLEESDLPHPVLEVYEHHTKNDRGDVLITVKQTSRQSRSRVKRETIGQWEMGKDEYSSFSKQVSHKFPDDS